MWHLHEVVISNSRVWMKIQASGESTEQAAAFFEARFNGTDYITADGHRPVTPFRLGEGDVPPNVEKCEIGIV